MGPHRSRTSQSTVAGALLGDASAVLRSGRSELPACSALLEAGPTSDLADLYGEADIELKRLHESILRQLFFC